MYGWSRWKAYLSLRRLNFGPAEARAATALGAEGCALWLQRKMQEIIRR